ncbi:hypothetical protein LCGC14_0729800 [marine sediment metagenome]|uniref:DUF3631 domain-containing protein n=1 Tax=marine sediment metagenome TaxID=412755 RepID=A0A0F9QE33_9ZZZZ
MSEKLAKELSEEFDKDPEIEKLFMSDKEFKKLEDSSSSLSEEKEEVGGKLKEAYLNIVDILKEYLDMKEEYYNIVALWIIGTYFHDKFPSYPYLFFNAMKGSGKSRTINLITCLAKDGSVQNSMTEAVLFRTNGTLAIDEFEGVSRKGNENLRELLNSAYKKGSKVMRMRQQKTDKGIEHVPQSFEVYRPIVLANIWGMENVLGDRCITLILEKSNKRQITNLMEIFREEKIVQETNKLLEDLVTFMTMTFSVGTYKKWNSFIKLRTLNNTNYINNTYNTNYTNTTFPFETIDSMQLNGRELELSFPLLLISHQISGKVLKETSLTLKSLFETKKEEELVENMDVSLYDFVSQNTKEDWVYISDVVKDFRDFLGSSDEWINPRWMGRALKRLVLVKEKKKLSRGAYVILNIKKAQEKIKMFK